MFIYAVREEHIQICMYIILYTIMNGYAKGTAISQIKLFLPVDTS